MTHSKMENMKYINKLVYLLILLSVSNFAQKRTKIDGVAAVIGNNIVLYSEIKAAKLQFEDASEGNNKISECDMVARIMSDKLLAHHAVIDSITVDDATINSEVDRKIGYFSNQLGTKDKMLEFFGFENISELKKELYNVEKESNLVKKMQFKITDNMDVTPEEVSNYFKSLKKENSLPEFGTEVVLGQIVIEAKPSEEDEEKIISRLKQLKAEIENGANFRMKAILYSEDPAASKDRDGAGGLYTITQQSQFVKEFKEAAFSLNEGEVSEPFKSQFGYHILRVEKIKGKERDVRHLLLHTEITDDMLEEVKDSLVNVRNDILTKKITFEEAVKKYSTDKDTNKNKGLLINPITNDTHFSQVRMDPALFARISNVKEGDFSEIFYDETREGRKMYKFLLMKEKIKSHIADLDKDYVKIKNLALDKKRQEEVEKWVKEKITDTYIKIHNQYKDCEYKYNWKKN